LAGALDHKRYIDRTKNLEFSKRFEAWIAEGRIPPFACLFPETEIGYIADKDKPGKDIVQLAFLVRDDQGNVLVSHRADFGGDKAAGHTVTVGDSVLVGWSPIELPEGRGHPASERDMLYAYHREVPVLPGYPPQCAFIGLIRNELERRIADTIHTLRYYFYLFEMSYPGAPDFSKIRFQKDKDDQPRSFHAIDDALASAVQDKKADLRALEAASGNDYSRLGYGKSTLVRPSKGNLPPFLDHPPGVFISHATSDDAVADRIAKKLGEAGISVWCDHRTLCPGQTWPWEISDAIKYGPCFILLCSEASLKSKAVQDEAALALERRKREPEFLVIPVVLEGGDKMQYVPKIISSTIWAADLREAGKRDAQIEELVARAREKIARCNYLFTM